MTVDFSKHDPCEEVVYNGRLMDYMTMAFIMAMEEKLGYNLTILKAKERTADRTSSATHVGGGVFDVAEYDIRNKIKVAAELGGFAYRRAYIAGLWPQHGHIGIRNHPCLSDEAKAQQRDWDARPPRDGLKGHALLNLSYQFHPLKQITFVYPPKGADVPKPTHVSRARDALVESIQSVSTAIAELDDANPERVVAKQQLEELLKERKRLRKILETLPKR